MAVRVVLAAIAAALVLAAPASAQDQPIIDRAAQSLRSDEVYVAPDAEAAISASDAQRIRRRISDDQAGPMYVAILPDAAKQEAGGSVRGVLLALHDALGRDGTYAVVAGRSFGSASNVVQGTGQAATDAADAHQGDGAAALLLDYVDRVGQLSSGGGSGGGGGGGTGAIVVLVLVALGGGALIVSRRNRRRREAQAVAELKENARDDLVALGDDIRALDLDTEMPDADPRAKAAYAQAVGAYDRADAAWQRARAPEDFEAVSSALEEGRWAMAAAEAHLDGLPVPERRPPCFFDPRHGPSTREVEWAPPGGVERPVPACEADAQRVERGEDPETRDVLVGGRRMPYWNAGPMYAPWAGGFFGGYGGGLLPGLLFGTLLGEAIAPPMVYGGDWGGDGGGWGGGGGDFGGGGGDFGGGDFGGGDF